MGKLSELFKWKKKVDINVPGREKPVTVWVRLVGDDAYKEARDMGTKASRLLRIKLKKSDTPEHKAEFADLDYLTKEEFANAISYYEMPSIAREAYNSIPEEPEPELSDDPSLEEQEEVQAKSENAESERTKKIAQYIESKTEERKKELMKLKLKELKDMYISESINTRCMDLFREVFQEYTVYKSVYLDEACKKPAFESFEEFKSSSPLLKNKLLDAYNTLEMSGEDLKN